jgi:hypothetical protein
MPGARVEDAPSLGGSRRSVVPTAAGRSLWLAALWTGAGAAAVCATLAIFAVAICWLPVSGSTGRAHSAIHAGLLTFLASVHGGITVDGTEAMFLPLGMTIAVGLTAWRAGVGLADAADEIGERDPLRLALAAGTQAASFMIICLALVPFSALGTSSAPFLGVGLAALLLFAAVGGTALALYSPLSDWCSERVPYVVGRGARGAVAVLTVYLGSGALLVAGSVVVHHARVEALSNQVGGGWGGVPILLLGVLAAPNAVIAGASYLAGPGFAVGAGTTASAFTTAHGTLPAFPILGAVPDGSGANAVTWLLMALTPIGAGIALARLAARELSWAERFRTVGVAALITIAALLVLGWQAGGSIGDGRLQTVGVSPWKFPLAVAVATGLIACAGLGAAAARAALRSRGFEDEPTENLGPIRAALAAVLERDDEATAVAAHGPDDADSDGKLAG